MKKYILLILILAVSYNAQTKRTTVKSKPVTVKPCALSKADKITLRGFYLGQDKNELSDIPNFDKEFEKNRQRDMEDRGKFGFVMVSHVDLSYQTPGVATPLGKDYDDVGFYLHFLDDKLMFVSVQYEAYEPDNLLTFIRQISAATMLPAESWIVKNKSHAEMKCVDFDVDVWTGKDASRPEYQDYPSLMLSDRIDIDVARVFPDSESVNEALRTLIIIAEQHRSDLSPK